MTLLPTHSLLQCLATHQNDTSQYYETIQQWAGERFVFHDASLNSWVVTGYEECVNLLHDSRLARARFSLPEYPSAPDLIEFAKQVLDEQLMFSDDPSISNCRKYWTTMITGGVECSQETASTLAAQALGEIKVNTRIDAYREVFRPYVSRVICTQLGVSEQERCEIYPYILQYARFLDGKLGVDEDLERALFSIAALYSRLAIKCKESQPNRQAKHRWISNFLLMLTAGHESTAYLLGTIFLKAGGKDGLLARAGVDERRLTRIITEALRYDSPVQLIGRRVNEPFQVNGHTFEKGDRLYLHIGAANRDPRFFHRPAEFDCDRSGPSPLSFGIGSSQCIGRSLALKEALVLLSAMGKMGIFFEVEADRVSWNNGLAGRSFFALPVMVRTVGHNN